MIFLLCLICNGCEPVQKVFDDLEKPKIKDKSTRKLIISGEIDPNITVHSIDVVYETHQSVCTRTLNWLEGVSFPRTYRVKFPVNANNGKYELELDTDKLEPGFCKWDVARIQYSLTLDGLSNVPENDQLAWFAEGGNGSLPPFDYMCKNKSMSGWLNCFSPLRDHSINKQTEMLNVSFRDRVWNINDKQRLGE